MVKRKAGESLQEALERLWCYYCEREFPAYTDLCQHQRAIHFRCQFDPRSCSRKLQTAGGLKVHMQQVHKSELREVPGALPDRKDLSVEVFAMDGIPEELLNKRRDSIIREFQLMEAEHLKRTGNSLSGLNAPAKKQKIEPAGIDEAHKERARRFKAKKMRERQQKKLTEEALARGEEPPVFPVFSAFDDAEADTPTATPQAAPVAAPVVAPIAAAVSASPPAVTSSHIPAADDVATPFPPGLHPLPPPPNRPLPPSTSGISYASLPTSAAYTTRPALYSSVPAPFAPFNPNSYNGYGPMVQPPYAPQGHAFDMSNRPAPAHDYDRFRENHPNHGKPSQPPTKMPVPSASPPAPHPYLFPSKSLPSLRPCLTPY